MKEKLMSLLPSKNKEKGFSLAELGIAMVIMLIIATIATISYFVFIDDAKNVKSVEDAGAIQTAVASIYAQEGDWGTKEGSDINFDTKDAEGKEVVDPLVFQAIGATLSINESNEVVVTNATNGLVVSAQALVDNDNNTVTTGNLTVDRDAMVISAEDVDKLIKLSEVDYNALREYLGAGVTEEAVEGYFVVTVDHTNTETVTVTPVTEE